MTTSVYPIYRTIGRPITFKGLKGQYILIAAAGLVGDLFLFVLLYCCRVPVWICIPTVAGLGAAALGTCVRFSRQYGVSGLQKIRARRAVPTCLRCRTRRSFTQLNT